MSKKARVLCAMLIAVVVVLAGACIFVAIASIEPVVVQREVLLELVNPITGEVIKGGDTIDLPKEETYAEVRIKDMETGVYLTDDDLPGIMLKGSYSVDFKVIKNGKMVRGTSTEAFWPSEINYFSNYYEVKMTFDCKPATTYGSKFPRQYKPTVRYVRFYVNAK